MLLRKLKSLLTHLVTVFDLAHSLSTEVCYALDQAQLLACQIHGITSSRAEVSGTCIFQMWPKLISVEKNITPTGEGSCILNSTQKRKFLLKCHIIKMLCYQVICYVQEYIESTYFVVQQYCMRNSFLNICVWNSGTQFRVVSLKDLFNCFKASVTQRGRDREIQILLYLLNPQIPATATSGSV